MDRRLRRAAIAAACVITLTFTAVAYGYVTTDLNDWNLSESTSSWGSAFHISSGTDGWVSYRWLDSPSKSTVISANRCSDLALYGSSGYGVNDTSYHALFNGPAGTCFVLRGRTGAGQGSMVNHDGRVQR
jgi:hypothetical protein